MAIKVGQIRYLGDNDSRNYPENLTAGMLTSGSFFESSIRIVDLTIQGDFDLAFYLNDTITPLKVAPSKVLQNNYYIWKFSDLGIENMPIYNLKFDAASLKHFLETNSKRPIANYLFIDYTYETMA